MKKIVTCILLCLFLFGNTAFAKNEDKETLLLKTKIENLKKEIKAEEKVQKKALKTSKKYDELGDAVTKMIELQWNDINIDDISWEGKADNSKTTTQSFSRSSWAPVTLETWDILVFKYKYPPYHCYFSNGWCHSALVSWNYWIEAVRYWINSRKKDLSYFFNNYPLELEKIIIIKMGLYTWQQYGLEQYVNQNLIWKPYPSNSQLPFSKYSMNKFYCSSLVWRAHYSSGKFTNLDEATSSSIVHPIELITSVNAWNLYSITY